MMPKTRVLFAAALAVMVAAGLSCKKNHPPDVPAVPTGPTVCLKNSTYTFASTATDPDGDSISVHFLWSETWPSNWSGWVVSGDTVSMTHAWLDEGTFQVRAEARDRKELSSGWSNALTVQVVYQRPPNKPAAPTGPGVGYQDSSYTFAAVAFHPDSINVAIRFSWGDGDSSDWSPYVAPGESVLMNHTWPAPDTYSVIVQAKDTANALSKWSASHNIIIRPPDTMSRWRFRLAAGEGITLTSSPAIGADGTIYVGSSDSSLYAVNPDGSLKWRYVVVGIVQSSPAVGADGTVYFGSDDNRLYALNPDGTLKWRNSIGGGSKSSPAIASDGTIYVGSSNQYVYAINPDSTHKWGYLTGGTITSSPAIATDGTIYIGSSDGYLYALNPDGTLKWRDSVGGSVYSSPAVGPDGTVYFGSDDNTLYAINADSTPKWNFSTGGNVRSSPVIAADGTIYVGSDDNNLHALYSDGTPKWAYPTGNNIVGAPAICSDGTIYFGSVDDNLYALNPDGTLKWRYETDHDIESSPTIGTDGTVYFTSDDGYLYALKGTGTLASTPWPKFHYDLANTGRVGGGR
jgi:outer membrane protein assembly factor BamB